MIFLWFSTQFTRFYKMALLFEIHSCTQVPGKFWDLTNMPLLCRLALRNNWRLAIRSLGVDRRGSGQIRASRRPGSAGCRRMAVRWAPRLHFWSRLGLGGGRRSRTAAAAASRGTPCSGELPAGARERAARSAPAGARGGIGTVARPWELVGTRLGGDDANGAWRRRACAREGAAPLK
jgi:hypothetical protein